jgi:hypothetical protein
MAIETTVVLRNGYKQETGPTSQLLVHLKVKQYKSSKAKGWIEKMRNREQWRLVVEEAKVHPGL